MNQQEIQKSIISLELAKKLKEIGVPQESNFIYDESYGPAWLRWFPTAERRGLREEDCPAAFTLEELEKVLHKLLLFYSN